MNCWTPSKSRSSTPPEITARLNKEVVEILAEPAFKNRLNAMGASTLPLSQAEFGALIARDTEKWARVIKAANIKPE